MRKQADKKHKQIDYFTLIWAIGLPLAVGVVGSLFTMPAIEMWYAGLEKPFFSPPNWLFGPVWTLLYIMMGVAFYLVLTAESKVSKNMAIQFFMGQLGLNLLWSIFFFGAQLPFLALLEIVVLLIAIVMTIRAFSAHSQVAVWLMLPYAAWVGFATLLNAAIVFLN